MGELVDLHPGVEKVLERYRPLVPDWAAFLEACARPLPTCGWISPARSGFEQVAALDGIRYSELGWRAGGVKFDALPSMAESLAYRAGLFHVQEEASMLPVALLAPGEQDRVLDLCAAPGNKTAEIAASMGGRGSVVANDRAGARLNVLRTTLDRLGLPNVSVTTLDGRSPQWPDGHFDAVLVDAPCSCEGTIRKHPRAPLGTGAAQRAGLADLQTALLVNALRATRPGGRVVYSTCTFAPEENESVVARALAAVPGTDLLPVDLPGLAYSPGITSWQGEAYPEAIRRSLRLWPGQIDAGGFFAAVLVRGRQSVADRPDVSGVGARPDSVAADVIGFFGEYFGLPDRWAEAFAFRVRRGKSLDVTDAGHDPDLDLAVSDRGFSLARLTGRVPKLTTQGALLLGASVSRQWVGLSRADALAFMRGTPTRPAMASSDEYGYVQVRTQGLPIGVGVFDPDTRVLTSQYPGAWAGLGPPGDAG